MSNVIIPRIWTRQPQVNVGIDKSNPLSRNLTCAWSTGGRVWYGPESSTYRPRTVGDSDSVGLHGLSRKGFTVASGTSPAGRLPDGAFGTATSGTRIALVKFGAVSGQKNFFTGDANSMQVRTNTAALEFVKDSVAVSFSVASAVSANEHFALGASYGSINKLYKNGVLIGSSSSNLVTTQSAASFVGHDGAGANDWTDGELFFLAAWDRQLSDGEVLEISRNPWQIFQPVKRSIFTGFSVGGGLNVTATLGTADASGYTAAVDLQNSITATLGTAAASGYDATVDRQLGVSATLATASASGYDASITFGNDLSVIASLGLASADGYQASVNLQNDITATLGTAAASGYDATVSFDATLTDSQKIDLILDILSNKQTLDSSTGLYTLYTDDGVTVLYTANAWEDSAGTIPYRGQALRRLDKLT